MCSNCMLCFNCKYVWLSKVVSSGMYLVSDHPFFLVTNQKNGKMIMDCNKIKPDGAE